jgi:hypothetical protein
MTLELRMELSHSKERTSRAADHKLLTTALRFVSHPRPSATYRARTATATCRRATSVQIAATSLSR